MNLKKHLATETTEYTEKTLRISLCDLCVL